MIKEDYVSYEVAHLLKEKGFDEPCHCFYKCSHGKITQEWSSVTANRSIYESEKKIEYVNAYTHQMACAWLREKHHIHILVTIGCDVDNPSYIFYWVGIAKFTESSVDYIDPFGDKEFSSNDESVEAALKYALENLI